jgi:hypothetical protein
MDLHKTTSNVSNKILISLWDWLLIKHIIQSNNLLWWNSFIQSVWSMIYDKTYLKTSLFAVAICIHLLLIQYTISAKMTALPSWQRCLSCRSQSLLLSLVLWASLLSYDNQFHIPITASTWQLMLSYTNHCFHMTTNPSTYQSLLLPQQTVNNAPP